MKRGNVAMGMRKVKKKWQILLFLVAILIVCYLLYRFQVIPHGQYTGEDFRIKPYVSQVDRDGDGVDDQTDLLENVREYIEKKPKYQSKYYASGFPDDGYGVCTDVVAFGMLGAGYDLQKLVNEDILAHREDYDIETVDRNIDFRRVRNLKVYFARHGIELTTDVNEISQWQGGDIVIFENHIGIVSDRRNKNGVPFLIHHASPVQLRYEEDVLERYSDIVGHYRIS